MGAGAGKTRPIRTPFVVRLPTGMRIRTRLRVSTADEQALRELGKYLGQLANGDLAARCHLGAGDADRARRKRALTSRSSSRWAGAITRTSNDQWACGYRNLTANAATLRRSTRIIEQRLRAPVGGREGGVRGYSTRAERWNKQRRLQILNHRLAAAEERLQAGQISVVRGGRHLARLRHNLEGTALSEPEWRGIWEARRLFLCADGEADKAWGNETIRVHPDEHWLEVKLPAALSHLSNRPHGRYRLSCPAVFSYRVPDWRAQIENGAVRYDILFSPDRNRWYLDASWTYSHKELPTTDEATASGVVSVDFNWAHLACWIIDRDGNPSGSPHSISFASTSPSSSALDGRIRSAVSEIISLAQARGCQAVAIEDLNFDDLRTGGRERHGRGRRGKQRRRMIAGMPTRRFRTRLVQMCANRGLWVVAVDPAYTSRWGRAHWLAPLQDTLEMPSAFITRRRWSSEDAQLDTELDGDRTSPQATGGSPPRRAVGQVQLGPGAYKNLVNPTPTLQRENDASDRHRRTELVRD